jgi:hypothetical protein
MELTGGKSKIEIGEYLLIEKTNENQMKSNVVIHI